MATVACKATLMLNTGELVEMGSDVVEGTETELLVSTNYAVSAVSLGQFADGKTITQVILPPSCPNGVSYALIDRRGEIATCLPVGIMGERFAPAGNLGFRLQAGDTLRVMASTAANRLFAYSVITNTGVHAIFSGSPTGAGNTDLTHIKSGQGVGTSLVGQSIVAHYATSVDGAKLVSGGILILNDKGLPVGGCMATNPQAQQVQANSVGGASIGLNFVGRVTTSS